MSYEDDDTYGHEDNRFAIPGLTDAEQIAGLRPRVGDISRRHNSNARWGSTVILKPQQAQTVIATEMFDSNIPIAVQLRWAANSRAPYTPVFPGGTGARVELLKSVDLKAGAANESFDITANQTQPFCVVICRQLSVTVKNLDTSDPDSGNNVLLHAAACRVTNVDCNDLLGFGNGYQTISQQEFIQTQLSTPILALAPNARRAQFFVQNTSSDSDVIIQWGLDAGFGPPAKGVMILPAGFNGVYESPLSAWTGAVTISFSNGTGDGGALITEGSF